MRFILKSQVQMAKETDEVTLQGREDKLSKSFSANFC